MTTYMAWSYQTHDLDELRPYLLHDDLYGLVTTVMHDNPVPQMVLYGELVEWKKKNGGQKLHHKDMVES